MNPQSIRGDSGVGLTVPCHCCGIVDPTIVHACDIIADGMTPGFWSGDYYATCIDCDGSGDDDVATDRRQAGRAHHNPECVIGSNAQVPV